MEGKSGKTQVSCMWLSSRCLWNRVSHCDSLSQIKGVLAAVAELGPAFSQCTHLFMGKAGLRGLLPEDAPERIAPQPNGSREPVQVTHSYNASHPWPGQSPLSTGTYRNLRCSHICAHSHGGSTCRHPSLGKMWGGEQPIIVEISVNSHAWGDEGSHLLYRIQLC